MRRIQRINAALLALASIAIVSLVALKFMRPFVNLGEWMEQWLREDPVSPVFFASLSCLFVFVTERLRNRGHVHPHSMRIEGAMVISFFGLAVAGVLWHLTDELDFLGAAVFGTSLAVTLGGGVASGISLLTLLLMFSTALTLFNHGDRPADSPAEE